MARPKKHLDVSSTFSSNPEASTPSAPTIAWLSLAKVPGGYAVLRATTRAHDVLSVEVLAGPLARGGASAALRVEMARAFLIGKGPK